VRILLEMGSAIDDTMLLDMTSLSLTVRYGPEPAREEKPSDPDPYATETFTCFDHRFIIK